MVEVFLHPITVFLADFVMFCPDCLQQVRLYDISAQRRPVISFDFRESPIKAVTEDLDGNTIYIGNGSGDLASVDIRTGKLLGCFLGKCSGSIRSIARHPEHPVLASCGILFSTRKHPKTKDLMPEDFWIRAPKKGIVVFALPGEPGLTELRGDFKIHFHDRQGDFYCWLNTKMMENRIVLNNSDLDGFDKRKIPSPGFQLEIVMIDYDGSIPTRKKAEHASKGSDGREGNTPSSSDGVAATPNRRNVSENQDNDDDVFSDSEGEETGSSKSNQARADSGAGIMHILNPAQKQIE